MKTEVLQTRISKRLLERFDSALEGDGLKRSDVVIQSIREYVEEYENRKDDVYMKFYGLLSNESGCPGIINEEDETAVKLEEGTDREINKMAKEENYKFYHLYTRHEDEYDQVQYKFVSSNIVG